MRVALRGLARSPGYALAAIAVLALGIGAATGIYAVVEAVTLAPLPYPDPDRLVVIWKDLEIRGIDGYPSAPADLADYRWAASFAGVAGASPGESSWFRTRGRSGSGSGG